MKSGIGSPDPKPATPITLAKREDDIISKSICGVVILGSRCLRRTEGRAKRIMAETRAFIARAMLTAARDQCWVREMY
jgi:hypothetical protein